MATLNQLSAQVINLLGQPFNHELAERVKDAFKNLRATRIRQSVEKNGMDDQFLMTLDVELTKVDKFDTCLVTAGCKVVRTLNEIPAPIRIKSDAPFSFIGTLDGVPFIRLRAQEVKYIDVLPFRDNVGYYEYRNKHLYIWNKKRLETIRIVAAFEDPEKAINVCADADCYNDDMEFPLAADMINSIIQEMLATQFKYMLGSTDEEVQINDTPNK